MTSHQYSVMSFGDMSDRLFGKFSSFIERELGIKMPEAKRTMLQARLQKRLRKLGIASFEDYADYVFSSRGKTEELTHMIDAVTTNKTDFFRESQHFDYLVNNAIPELIRNHGVGIRKRALFWSAGCSSGEEVYTLAMVLNEFHLSHRQFQFLVLGTDVSAEVLRSAVNGVYSQDKIDPIPIPLRKRYLLRSKDPQKKLVRISADLRAMTQFRRLNFMNDHFSIQEMADVIFCRNVLIYFDRTNQEKVLNRLCRHLLPGGFLFTGHSETLNGLNVPLVQATSTIYRKPIK